MRIVSFSYFLPYAGVPHAGGEYYLRHVLALKAAGHRVTVVVPATHENGAATAPAGIDVLLVEESRSLVVGVVDTLNEKLRAAALPARFTQAVLRDARVAGLLERADLLEFQWVPAAGLRGPLVRRTGFRGPCVCIAHDVVGQSLLRLAQQPGVRADRRAVRRLRAAIGRFDERRHLRDMDVVLTFSEKDRGLLRGYGAAAELIDPPLAEAGDASAPIRPAGSRLLFVGAFDRVENSDAADWLLNDIWPHIRRAHPEASLDLVGAKPTPSMLRAALDDPSVSVTGYVDDLDPFYSQAALALVPLRLGAGVKFKAIVAMLRGVPVIATGVGAEGISERGIDGFVAVEDESSAFADAVVRHLADPRAGRTKAEAARRSALQRYGFEGFQRRLDDCYRGVARQRCAA